MYSHRMTVSKNEIVGWYVPVACPYAPRLLSIVYDQSIALTCVLAYWNNVGQTFSSPPFIFFVKRKTYIVFMCQVHYQ
jgi:hypothetical protein